MKLPNSCLLGKWTLNDDEDDDDNDKNDCGGSDIGGGTGGGDGGSGIGVGSGSGGDIGSGSGTKLVTTQLGIKSLTSHIQWDLTDIPSRSSDCIETFSLLTHWHIIQ